MGTTAGNESSAREQVQEKTQQVTGQAREKAQQAAGQAKSRVREQVDQRSTDAGRRVGATASDIRSVGDELRKQGKDQPAKLADQVADRAERVGGYLERADGDTILRDVEDFGRRQPWAVILGGLAVGFAASRLLKASSEGRYQQSRRDLGNRQWSPERELHTEGTGQIVGPPQTAATPQMAGM
jgi:hypothetical protein